MLSFMVKRIAVNVCVEDNLQNVHKFSIGLRSGHRAGLITENHFYRRTPRNEPMYMPAGTCFVYQTYGMYFMLNISSKEPGAAVLLRAIEPLEGLELMEKLRKAKSKGYKGEAKLLCNGPAKLCISMDIKKDICNTLDLTDKRNDLLWIEDDSLIESADITVVRTSRIGIDSVGPEWASKPLRFYILGNSSVSKRNKKAEEEVEGSLIK